MDIEKIIQSGKTSLEDLTERLASPLDHATQGLIDRAFLLEKWPLAKLISIFERSSPANYVLRHQISGHLLKKEQSKHSRSVVFGITGTPGAGKSSLTGALCSHLLAHQADLRIAILAIDPSSQDSGGSLLGDRTRTVFPADEKRLFFRSQASELDLGGMGKQTFQVTRLLRHFFDIIFIETVGIGQSEIEVSRLADHTLLVMQPLAGDQVQFMKAGIMEIPDTFVVNKCDEEALAKKSLHLLRSSLKLAKIYVHQESQEHDIFLTSATQKIGIETLSNKILEECQKRRNDRQSPYSEAPETPESLEQYFLEKGVKDAYGNFGITILKQQAAQGLPDQHSSIQPSQHETYEQKEVHYYSLINKYLSK